MAVLSPPSREPHQASSEAEVEWPRPRLFTIEEYERAGELGVLDPDERLELLEGKTVRKISPQLTPHATCINLAQDAVYDLFGKRCVRRIQQPSNIESRSQPEPDLCVVKGPARDYLAEHPREALLIVEVADTTLRTDLGRKALLYARGAVPDYWVVNLKARTPVAHRNPVVEARSRTGYRCDTIPTLSEGETVKPIHSSKEIKVADLLP
jgi:Uma2 family endonuclease